MAIEYNFTLDMDRSKRDNNIAYARTGDVDSITINADLVLDGAAYTPTGTNAFFECVTPNGHSVRAAAQKTGSSVSVEVPSAAFQAAGVINVAYFRFETGEADNPTYVESTEPFAIVVREGIGDDIDAGDYIEEWRQLADSLDEIAKEVQQKATQAQTSIAKDTVAVENAKNQAISNIDSSQGAVDAAIDQLEEKTQEAVDAAQEAIDGTLATDLKNAINRTLKLDVADMVNISDNTSLSSLTAVGSYCCKTASAAATIGDCPIDDSPFNMYVFSSATSGQVMQLVVPIDLHGRSSAEWYVRFGTSSAMDQWSVIGGMPDIVPVSQGGTGATTAAQARQNLGAGTSDFSGDYNDLRNKPDIPEPIATPVSISNGGTGAATAKAAEYNILGGMITDGSDPEDTSNFAMVRGEPSSADGVLFKSKGTSVWNWIASKIRSVFGFDASNVLTVAKGGTGSTSASEALTALGAAKASDLEELRDSVSQSVKPMRFTKLTSDPQFDISGIVLGGAVAVVSFRWVNNGEFQSQSWSSGVQLAKIVGWSCPREHQSVCTDNITTDHRGGGVSVACVIDGVITWRTSSTVTVDAGLWHEGQLVFPVTKA